MTKKGKHKKVTGAALIGNAIEWYDFYIYGTCAALIFPAVFFPNVNPAIGLIIALASYGVGFITRPLGAIIFGHFGDKIGRRQVLMASLLLMGFTTFTIGILPGYEKWGLISAFILIGLRLLQGIAVGGEWGSAVVMATEHAPEGRKGFFGSLVQIGAPIGMLLSTGAFALLYANFTEAEILAWAWRIPFIASLGMIGIGLYIRLKVEESPEFEEIKRNNAVSKMPVKELLKKDWRKVLQVGASRVSQNLLFNTSTIFYLSYATNNLGISKDVPLMALFIATSLSIFNMPFWAFLSDKVGRRKIAIFGNIASIAFTFPAILLLETKASIWVVLAIVGIYVINDICYSVQSTHIPEQFDARTRITGANLGYNLGGMVSGMVMPLMGVILAWQNNIYHVGIFLVFICLVSLACVLPETLHKKRIS